MIRLTAPITITAEAAADGDTPSTSSRTIEGVAVPWDVTAAASTGPVMFLKGSLPTDGPAPKVFLNHDPTKAVGLVVDRQAADDGMRFRARLSATSLGDEALTLALDGVIDAVSVGVNVIEAETIDGITVVAQAEWVELSMTPTPAFAGAVIDKVAATTTTPTPEPTPQETPIMPIEPTPEVVSTSALTFTARPRRPITAGRYIAETLTGQYSPDVAAVIAEDAAADVAGVIPELLIGSVFDTLNGDRPVISALGTLAMPGGGETFNRRKVTQHTSVDTQAAEFDELASQAYQVDKVPVSKVWKGGTVSVSEQATAYADVTLIDAIVTDMARVYALNTDLYVADFIATNSGTASSTIADFTDGDEVIEDLYLAAAEIKAATRLMPTHLIVTTSVWAKLGAAKDSGGNRIFPYLGPSNAAGTAAGVTSVTMNPLGLSLVVSDDIAPAATDGAIMLNSRVIEVYEDRRGALRVESPSTLSTTLAFRGVIACADLDLTTGSLSLV
jgi:HK97 family phage prohead protease